MKPHLKNGFQLDSLLSNPPQKKGELDCILQILWLFIDKLQEKFKLLMRNIEVNIILISFCDEGEFFSEPIFSPKS